MVYHHVSLFLIEASCRLLETYHHETTYYSYDLRLTTYDLRPTTYDLRPTTYDLRPTTYDLQLKKKSSYPLHQRIIIMGRISMNIDDSGADEAHKQAGGAAFGDIDKGCKILHRGAFFRFHKCE